MDNTDPPKKKRGRPRKEKAPKEKKPRGRPRKTQSQKQEQRQNVKVIVNAPAAPKRRYRRKPAAAAPAAAMPQMIPLPPRVIEVPTFIPYEKPAPTPAPSILKPPVAADTMLPVAKEAEVKAPITERIAAPEEKPIAASILRPSNAEILFAAQPPARKPIRPIVPPALVVDDFSVPITEPTPAKKSSMVDSVNINAPLPLDEEDIGMGKAERFYLGKQLGKMQKRTQETYKQRATVDLFGKTEREMQQSMMQKGLSELKRQAEPRMKEKIGGLMGEMIGEVEKRADDEAKREVRGIMGDMVRDVERRADGEARREIGGLMGDMLRDVESRADGEARREIGGIMGDMLRDVESRAEREIPMPIPEEDEPIVAAAASAKEPSVRSGSVLQYYNFVNGTNLKTPLSAFDEKYWKEQFLNAWKDWAAKQVSTQEKNKKPANFLKSLTGPEKRKQRKAQPEGVYDEFGQPIESAAASAAIPVLENISVMKAPPKGQTMMEEFLVQTPKKIPTGAVPTAFSKFDEMLADIDGPAAY